MALQNIPSPYNLCTITDSVHILTKMNFQVDRQWAVDLTISQIITEYLLFTTTSGNKIIAVNVTSTGLTESSIAWGKLLLCWFDNISQEQH